MGNKTRKIVLIGIVVIGVVTAVALNMHHNSDFSTHYDLDDVYVPMDLSADEIKYLTGRADSGDIPSKYILSVAYENGDGVTADKVKSFRLLQEAAEPVIPRHVLILE